MEGSVAAGSQGCYKSKSVKQASKKTAMVALNDSSKAASKQKIEKLLKDSASYVNGKL